MAMKDYEFWFIVGSQLLYGPEVLETVAERAGEMVEKMNAAGLLPCRMAYKMTAKSPEEISRIIRDANYDDGCAGVILWMHTFSPSKNVDQRPEGASKSHTVTSQPNINRQIPNEEIDMDFMNLNQAGPRGTANTAS